MNPFFLEALDLTLSFLHGSVIAINLFGWIWPASRSLQRGVLLLTALSWLVLGAAYGWGYCFLTDWHWDVKRALGETGLPASYIQYHLRNKWGFDFSDHTVDLLTATVFAGLVTITLSQIWRERRKHLSKEA